MPILNPNRVEVPFTFQGHALTLVFDNMTIARFEMETGISIIKLMTEMAPLTPEQVAAGHPPKDPPRLTVLAHLLLAALLEKHPDASLGDAMAMIVDPGVQKLFGEGFRSAMPQAEDLEEDGGQASANPPRRRAPTAVKPGHSGKAG